MLRDLYSVLRAKQLDLLFAQIRGSVQDRMQQTGLLEHIGADHLYASTAATVTAFHARSAPIATPEASEYSTLDVRSNSIAFNQADDQSGEA